MKLSRVLSFLVVSSISGRIIDNQFNSRQIPRAVSEIIKSEKLAEFEIVCVGNKTKDHDVIIRQIIQADHNVSFVVSVIDEDENITRKLLSTKLVLFGSVSNLERFLANELPQSNFLFYFSSLTRKDFVKLTARRNFQAMQISYLLLQDDVIELPHPHCRTSKFNLVNTFNISSKKWRTKTFFPEKFLDFTQPVVEIFFHYQPPYLWFKFYIDGHEIGGTNMTL